jgi:hypothetical protein
MTVHQTSTIFNGACCEEAVTMSAAEADAHVAENAATYLGFGTLDARPGEVYLARRGAALFPDSPGCTAHLLDDAEPEEVDGQPRLGSVHTSYERPGQAAFLPEVRLFRTEDRRQVTSASEVVEGGLGSCWLLGAVASVAEHPGAIPRLVTEKRDGGYEVELFDPDAKRWRTHALDDALPACGSADGLTPAYARPGAGEVATLWPCLLEKAFAVAFERGYAGLNGGHAHVALQMLTGSRRETLECEQFAPEDLHAEVSDLLRSGHAVVASTPFYDESTVADLVFEDGLAQIHVYSVLATRSRTGGALELQVRNPWGRRLLLQPGDELRDQPDGTFWLPASVFTERFGSVEAARVEPA